MTGMPGPADTGRPTARRAGALAYGAICYLVFLGTFLYSIGFVGNLLVGKSIDSGLVAPPAEAAAVDVLLLGLFAVQHSVMARPAFKRVWTRVVPSHLERSTYVLVSSLLLALLFWQWRPIPAIVWESEHALASALWVLFGAGWLIVLISTFLIDHFDLFGLRQVVLYARGQPYLPPTFRVPALYRVVRHPIMLGFLIAFWAAPTMTWGHLLFAGLTTAYILIGVTLEERDLVRAHGASYQDYRSAVGLLLPRLPRRGRSAGG
jgi:protein-S-isoprenylcysteine O-methyltransferase Ste14